MSSSSLLCSRRPRVRSLFICGPNVIFVWLLDICTAQGDTLQTAVIVVLMCWFSSCGLGLNRGCGVHIPQWLGCGVVQRFVLYTSLGVKSEQKQMDSYTTTRRCRAVQILWHALTLLFSVVHMNLNNCTWKIKEVEDMEPRPHVPNPANNSIIRQAYATWVLGTLLAWCMQHIWSQPNNWIFVKPHLGWPQVGMLPYQDLPLLRFFACNYLYAPACTSEKRRGRATPGNEASKSIYTC